MSPVVDIPVNLPMSRAGIVQLAALGLLALAGLFSLAADSTWPLLAVAALLTVLFRFRAATRAMSRATEMVTVALIVISVLNRLGLDVIFVYKACIALLLFVLVLLEKDDIPKIFSRRSNLYANIRVSSLVALAGVMVVAAGHFLYRGEGFSIVKAPWEIIVLVGIGWSLLNSVSEEFIYRGLLYARLKDMVGASGALVGQAAIFGIAHHWTRVPLGLLGMVISFLFALSLGWLVRRAGSLFAVIFAHFWVDLALFSVALLRQ